MSGETFGQMLRRLRIERALSQNELARQAGVDAAYVNRLERAGEPHPNGGAIKRHLPSREIILALAAVLDLSYAERDRFLFCSGLATDTDWQSRCEDAEAALQLVRDAVGALNTAVEPIDIRRRTG